MPGTVDRDAATELVARGALHSCGGDPPINGGLALGPSLRMRWPQVGHVSFGPRGRRRVSHDKRRFGTPPFYLATTGSLQRALEGPAAGSVRVPDRRLGVRRSRGQPHPSHCEDGATSAAKRRS